MLPACGGPGKILKTCQDRRTGLHRRVLSATAAACWESGAGRDRNRQPRAARGGRDARPSSSPLGFARARSGQAPSRGTGRSGLDCAAAVTPTSANEENQRNVGMLLAIDFHVGIRKIVQRLAILRRIEARIAAHAELHSIGVVRAEEVIAFLHDRSES